MSLCSSRKFVCILLVKTTKFSLKYLRKCEILYLSLIKYKDGKNATNMPNKGNILWKYLQNMNFSKCSIKIERKNCGNCCEIICGNYIFVKIRILPAKFFTKTEEVFRRISAARKFPRKQHFWKNKILRICTKMYIFLQNFPILAMLI